MANTTNAHKKLLQNLQDAGCSNELTQKCMFLLQERKVAEILRLLSQHKRTLLEKVHIHQKEIDCLDYLVYQIGKNEYERKD